MVYVPQLATIGSKRNPNTFVVSAQIQIDGLGLQTKALCDIGANIYLSISPQMVGKVIQHLGARIKTLRKPIRLVDYRKRPAGQATHKLVATFELDGRQFLNQDFLIIETGHDIFIGQGWLTEQDVWIHPRTRAFRWPDDKPKLAQFSPVIIVSSENRKPDKTAQADMERRDELMRQEERQFNIQRIMQNPWRLTEPSPTLSSSKEPLIDVAALCIKLESDPR